MDFGIANKWALVCAASKGLGRGCAEALVNEGVNVVINARGADALKDTARQLKVMAAMWAAAAPGRVAPQVIAVAADITTEAGRAAVLNAEGGPGTRFDILVNNAGGPPPGDFRDWDREAWIKALDANMLTPIALIQTLIDGMAERGFGRVINITSSSVKSPVEVLGLSNGARSGLHGFVAGVARESRLVSRGVTINNLLPGKFDTDRLAGLMQGMVDKSGKSLQEVRAAQAAPIPAKRFGTPAEFGAVCAFLCSQQAGYLTGQNILLDGGAYPGTF